MRQLNEMKASPDSKRQTVLVIDDDPITRKVLVAHLSALNVDVLLAVDGDKGRKLAHAANPDLILLDVQMPGNDGFEVCRALKQDVKTAHIPIIFLTGEDRTDSKIKAFELGANDYVTKPFNFAELNARVAATLRMARLTEELDHQAHTDQLTGMPNRHAFNAMLGQAFEQFQHDKSYNFVLLFLDCDRFKVINDSLGHVVGDKLLRQMAMRINTILSTSGLGDEDSHHIAARLGGDEFVIMLDGVSDMEAVETFAERMQNTLGQHYYIEDHRLKATVSIGIVSCDPRYGTPQDSLRDADTAMYQAKRSGKARHVVFDQQMHEQALMRLTIENDLHDALANNEIQVYYQPIMSMENGRIAGFEALVRWIHPERGMISPAQFIPVAEETGLILPIGRFVLEQACKQLKTWRQRIPGYDHLTMNVNISRRQMELADFPQVVAEVVRDTGVDPHHMKLEITESIIMQNVDEAIERMNNLKEIGCQLSMDDFGTGHSSLSCLSRFPIDNLKIDREFIMHMTQDRTATAVLYSIITLAQNLNLTVVAEGLETEEQVAALLSMDCDYAQGYYFSKPVAAPDAENLLIKGIHSVQCA